MTRCVLEASMILTGAALGCLMFTQVVLREVGSSFLGFEEAANLIGLWLYFLGFAYAAWNQNTIGGGLETLIFKSPRAKLVHKAIVSLISAVFLSFILVKALEYYAFVTGNGRVSTYLRWPRGYWASSLVIGVTIASLAHGFQAFRVLSKLPSFRGQP